MFYSKIYLCWRFLKVFLLYVEIHLYYLLCPLTRFKKLNLITVHDIILVLPVILFLEIRFSKGSRTTLWQRTKKSNTSMDLLRDSEAGSSILTIHDFSVYKFPKEKSHSAWCWRFCISTSVFLCENISLMLSSFRSS